MLLVFQAYLLPLPFSCHSLNKLLQNIFDMDSYIKEMAGLLFSKIKASKRLRSLKLTFHNLTEHFWKFFSVCNLSFQSYWH